MVSETSQLNTRSNGREQGAKNVKKQPKFITVWVISLIVSVLYISSEWFFLVTKPSFMDFISTFSKVRILIFGTGLLALVVIILQSLLYFVASFKKPSFLKQDCLLTLIPAAILTITLTLLVDNFTYTVLGWGIVTSRGMIRVLYTVSFIVLFALIMKDLLRFGVILDKGFISCSKTIKRAIGIFFLLLAVSTIGIIIRTILFQPSQTAYSAEDFNRKNVVLITADGLNAEQMSIYGYEKNTTPFLKSISINTNILIAENNFTNSRNTTGSLTSILTGRYPTTTRVLYRPDILSGEDSYKSLPAILKSLGYYTIQHSYGYYADAYQINFKGAFDVVNGRTVIGNSVTGMVKFPLPSHYEYFISELQNRLLPRLRHIFWVQEMENDYQNVTRPKLYEDKYDDHVKMVQVSRLLAESTQPVFAHIHWMGTHGSKFFPTNRVFSEGKDISLQGQWEMPYYEDAILDFDSNIKYLYNKLEKSGKLKDTIIIIAADHGMEFSTMERTPLIAIIPEMEFEEAIKVDTQNLDIAPTILDYLGIHVPDWMDGQSLLKPINKYRPIIGVGISHVTENEEGRAIVNNDFRVAPFYQFDFMSVENCGNWTMLDLEENYWVSELVPGYTSTCEKEEIIDKNEIRQIIINRFKQDNFEFDESIIP